MAELIRVSAQSRSTAVAGAIAGVMREQGYAEIQAIGASAINQAIKAVTIARGYLEQDDMDLVIVPSFTEVDIDGAERTAVRMSVYKRPISWSYRRRRTTVIIEAGVQHAVQGGSVRSFSPFFAHTQGRFSQLSDAEGNALLLVRVRHPQVPTPWATASTQRRRGAEKNDCHRRRQQIWTQMARIDTDADRRGRPPCRPARVAIRRVAAQNTDHHRPTEATSRFGHSWRGLTRTQIVGADPRVGPPGWQSAGWPHSPQTTTDPQRPPADSGTDGAD